MTTTSQLKANFFTPQMCTFKPRLGTSFQSKPAKSPPHNKGLPKLLGMSDIWSLHQSEPLGLVWKVK